MAVLDILPGIEVTISVGGIPLEEFRDFDDEEAEDYVSRYVKAVSGQKFGVTLNIKKGTEIKGNALCSSIYIDGRSVGSRNCAMSQFANSDFTTVFEKGFVNGFRATCAFMDLETVDDGRAYHVELQRADEIGTIKAEVHYGIRNTNKSRRINTKENDTYSGEGTKRGDVVNNIVSEKAIKGKGLTHSVSFSDFERCKPQNHKFRHVDPAKKPVAVFEFKYRSEAFLKSLLLIPRTPTPPPLEERTAEALSLADIAELQRQLKVAKTQELARVTVKREREQADESPCPRKVARANTGDIKLEIDGNGEIRETSVTSGTPVLREIIELD